MNREAAIGFIRSTSDSPTQLSKILGVSPQRADQLLHPEKHRARVQVNKNKELKPDHCQICGKRTKDLEGHHYNYQKPEDVIWSCKDCHILIRGW